MCCYAFYQFRPARLFTDALVSFFAVTLMCATAFSNPQTPQQVVNQEKSIPITRLVVTFGTNTTPIWGGGIWDELRIVVRDRTSWETLWKRIVSPDPYHDPYQAVPSLPEIDFSREMLVVAAMGRRPTTGYRVLVKSAREGRSGLEVEVESISACGTQMQILTAPIDIVRIPRIEMPVTFRETVVNRDCK